MRLGLWAVWMAGAVWAQTAAKPPVTLRVHLIVPCGAPGAGGPVKVSNPDARLCLEKKPFLTQADVETAEVQPASGGRTLVLLTFHHDAAMRELQVTMANIGNRVGILLNGRMMGTPVISAGSRLLYIDGGFTRQQAEEIVGAFNRGLAAQHKSSAK